MNKAVIKLYINYIRNESELTTCFNIERRYYLMKTVVNKIAVVFFSMCFFISCTSFAASATNETACVNESVIKIDEYKEITKLQNMTDEELEASGYSSSEISSIKDFSYKEALKKELN